MFCRQSLRHEPDGCRDRHIAQAEKDYGWRRWQFLLVNQRAKIGIESDQYAIFAYCPGQHVGVGSVRRNLGDGYCIVPLELQGHDYVRGHIFIKDKPGHVSPVPEKLFKR